MRDDRRLWIYSGLAVPDGVATARPSVYRTEPRQGALLIGREGQTVRALLQAMSRLPLHRVGGMVVDLRPDTDLQSWAQSSWMDDYLDQSPADVVLAALTPVEPVARQSLEQRAADHGARMLWLSDPGVFAPGCLSAPVRATASEIASWAGQVFDVIS
jgi:hypothetical protein